MQKIEVFCKGNGIVKNNGFTPFHYRNEIFLGNLQRERFIGNAANGQSCLLWQVLKGRENFWNISTSVIWRVCEVRMPLTSAVEKDVFFLPLISCSKTVETRQFGEVTVVKKKKQLTLQVTGKHALWLFNACHRWCGSNWEEHIADTFLAGFVDTYC
jgi:hypothetical protein